MWKRRHRHRHWCHRSWMRAKAAVFFCMQVGKTFSITLQKTNDRDHWLVLKLNHNNFHPRQCSYRRRYPKSFSPFSSFAKLFSASINEIILKPRKTVRILWKDCYRTLSLSIGSFSISKATSQTIINILIRCKVASGLPHTKTLHFFKHTIHLKLNVGLVFKLAIAITSASDEWNLDEEWAAVKKNTNNTMKK